MFFVAVLLVSAAARGALAVDNGLGLLPPRGWNTWCTNGPCGYDVCDEDEVRSVGEALVSSGLAALGFNYVNLDDCWADYRDAQGNLHEDPTRFPSGMAALASYLHSLGLKLGLYTDAGLYTCSQGQRNHSIPGSYGHYLQDAATFASWGVDYVKMDWCNTNVSGQPLKPELQYSQMSAALNGTGRPIFFESCEWGRDSPWLWMRNYANAWRATQDHHDAWTGNTDVIIEEAAGIAQYSGPGGFNYLDFLMTGGAGCSNLQPMQHCPGMTDVEYRTEFSIWVMAGSPLIVATDVRNITAIMREVLFNTELLDIHWDPLVRAGGRVASANCAPNPSQCEVWARPLFNGDYYVLGYNPSTEPVTMAIDMAAVGWGGFEYSARDLWLHQDLGVFSEPITVKLDPHGVAALRVSFAGVPSAA